MAEQDPQVLLQLRELFRAELEDQIANMTRLVALLADESLSEDAKGHAASELYRAVHSLKGAAGAVGLSEPERICHQLEDKLATEGTPLPLARTPALLAQVRASIALLRDFYHRDSSPRMDSEPAAPPTDVRKRPSTVPPPPSGGYDSVAPSEFATTRVSLNRLDDLLTATNDWLVRLQASIDNAALEDALDVLESESGGTKNENDARARERTHQIAQKLKNHYLEMRVKHDRWTEGLRLHASHVARRVRELRLRPVGQLSDALERAALEGAKSEGKSVQFVFTGGDRRADHQVVERLGEPLLQLVRNAVVHGIEPTHQRRELGKPESGQVRISARAEGSELSIIVSDDGAGLDVARLRQLALERGRNLQAEPSGSDLLDLVCTPGLSTRAQANTQAGRGIGMDLVKDRIERLQGRIALDSAPGRGTEVRIRVPLDLSLLEVLVIASDEQLFALSTSAVQQMRRVASKDLVAVEERLYVRHGGALIPVADFRTAFDASAPPLEPEQQVPCVVLEAGEKRAALLVERLIAVGEYVAKPLSERARGPLAHAAILHQSGRLAPLLDAQALCWEAANSNFNPTAREDHAPSRAKILIVDDSVTTRQLVRIILESAGYQVDAEASGEAAWSRLRDGERFDAVVTDIEMPKMSGLELLTRIRASARLRELPVVLVTALAQDEDRRRALDLGADAYVVKSRFDQQALLETIEELVG